MPLWYIPWCKNGTANGEKVEKTGKKRDLEEIFRPKKNPQSLVAVRVCQCFAAGVALFLGAQEGKRTSLGNNALMSVWCKNGT